LSTSSPGVTLASGQITASAIVAVSPTDTLPLTHRMKGLMAIQSMISLAVLVVVISRVINILPA
jgi:hypothetical protein